MNTVPTLGWVAVGFGTCFALTIIAVCIIDPILIWRGQKTISRRTLEAGQRSPVAAVFIAAVLALLGGLLTGHLLLGQVVTQTACSCKAGAVCAGKCPDPCPCRPRPVAVCDCNGDECDCNKQGVCACTHDPEFPILCSLNCPCDPVAAQKPDGPSTPDPDPKGPERMRLTLWLLNGCPHCAAIQAELKKLKGLRDYYTVSPLYRYPKGPDPLAKAAKVTSFPTLIRAKEADRKEISRLVGYHGVEELRRWLELPPSAKQEEQAGSCWFVGRRLAELTQPVPDAKPILLVFTGKVNPVCIKLRRELERRPDVTGAIRKAYDVRLYDWAADKDQCDKYAVTALPTAVVLDGETQKERKRTTGYKAPNEILRWLDLPCPQ